MAIQPCAKSAGILCRSLKSVFALNPDTAAVIQLPVMVQIHIVSAFVLICMIPFTRLIHFLVYPLAYIWRPYEVVIWNYKGS